MPNKYFLGRIWKRSGRKEYQMHKCCDNFCDEGYIKRYPERVWQFSKQGAQNIANRKNAAEWNKNCEYFIIPVEEILGTC